MMLIMCIIGASWKYNIGSYHYDAGAGAGAGTKQGGKEGRNERGTGFLPVFI